MLTSGHSVNTGLIGSMKQQTAMGKNLAHVHCASLTTIWWLSAQAHCDQVGAEMTYFEWLLKKKKQFSIIIIHIRHVFQKLS